MPLMKCPPGASLQTLDGKHYIDTGLGAITIDDHHVDEVKNRPGWSLAEDEHQATIDEALNHLSESIAEEQEKINALRDEALQVASPAERADMWNEEEQAVFDERWVSEHEGTKTQAGTGSAPSQTTEAKTGETAKPTEEPASPRRGPRR